MLIKTTEDLERFARSVEHEPFITVDTEFMRDRTYWPKLCLVQVAGSSEAVAIDPLAPGIDLAPLLELMANRTIVKVFHAARQDLEIFFKLMDGTLPTPLFDSQIAAMVCGFGEEVAYETLVVKLAGASLDKTSRFTDWSRRPLSEAQLRYALGDVTHLREIYWALVEQIERAGRRDWVEAELENLLKPSNFVLDPAEAWKRLKIRSRDGRFIAICRALAEWREIAAQTRDLPRARIIRDDLLMEIAAHKPTSVEALRQHDRINLDKESSRQVVETIEAAMAIPKEALPKPPAQNDTPRGIGPLIDMLRVLLKLRCEENDVAQRLVANSSDLEKIAIDDEADVAALKGWRREIFGAEALDLKAGRIALTVNGKQPSVVRLDPRP